MGALQIHCQRGWLPNPIEVYSTAQAPTMAPGSGGGGVVEPRKT